ncbi:MAG: hypothetical protein AABY22_07230 [Nanoarchaeota archaeon]
MRNKLVSLALTASLLGFPVLAEHGELDRSKLVREQEFIYNFEGIEVPLGIERGYKLYDEHDMEWDIYTYIPFCNKKIEHPFIVYSKFGGDKGEVSFYNFNGKLIRKMSGAMATKLPDLKVFSHPDYKYNCPEK